MEPVTDEPTVELHAAAGTQSTQIFGFGPGAGAAPALVAGVARGRPSGGWLSAELVAWVRPQLLSALVVPVGAAWRPGGGRVSADLGVAAGPALTLSGPPTWRSDDEGGWERASGARAAGWVGLRVGGAVQVSDTWSGFVRAEQAFQLSWGVAGVPVLPHRTLIVGLRGRVAGAR